MNDGELDKKRYRTFNVRGEATAPGAAGEQRMNDDYGAMYEVLARRFRRALKADASARRRPRRASPRREPRRRATWEAPDLFVVDGGRGQLAVALAAAHDLGLHELPIVGLAKERENVARRDAGRPRVPARPEEPHPAEEQHDVAVPPRAPARRGAPLLEPRAHAHRQEAALPLAARRREGPRAPAKKALLHARRRTCAAIRAADDATLLAVPGVTARHVRALREALPTVAYPGSPARRRRPADSAGQRRCETANRVDRVILHRRHVAC